ncbi:MAG: EAL domain-containing protein [Acidimicrobiales bacterium]|nr:EAL domain-containing protein [Acidimicrobiales bacterium]
MGRQRDSSPNALRVDHLVETEHKAGTDLAWIVVFGTILCVLAIAFAVPDAVLDRVADRSGINANGIIALTTVVPLGASVFAFRRYRDAVGAQRELTHLSLHDALTGLPNRRHLREVLPEAFRVARRHHTKAAVIFIDLDGFKAVNDTYGHEVGDRLMAAVGERLRRTAGDDRWVARYAGDEFVIIDPAPQTAEHAVRFSKDLVGVIETPFELGADQIGISASIGVAFGDVTDEPEEVLHDADTAMYDAKHSENRAAVFSESMRARLTPATAERRLQRALADGEFRLLFQPILALRANRIVGCEALLRWDDPDRGLIPPGDFLGSLEDTGLIVPVGRWVIEEACRQAARWASLVPEGQPPLRVTTNVSPRQIGQSDFVDDLRGALLASGIDPSLLYLELTESGLIADPRAAWTALSAARELGVGLALDDFGTGYSSLSHLRNFDLELLKLDGSYISGLGERESDEAIVRHVVSLARALGIATLAEGVQSADQVERLLDIGCELGQGYFFSEPQPPTIIESLLQRQINGVQPVTEPTAEDPVLPAPSMIADPTPEQSAAIVLPKLRQTTPVRAD